MKKVQANWLSQGRPKQAEYDSLKALIENESYVGFIPKENYGRYMVLVSGEYPGAAINNNGNWVSFEEQESELGEYFIFDTYSELLDWMKG